MLVPGVLKEGADFRLLVELRVALKEGVDFRLLGLLRVALEEEADFRLLEDCPFVDPGVGCAIDAGKSCCVG